MNGAQAKSVGGLCNSGASEGDLVPPSISRIAPQSFRDFDAVQVPNICLSLTLRNNGASMNIELKRPGKSDSFDPLARSIQK